MTMMRICEQCRPHVGEDIDSSSSSISSASDDKKKISCCYVCLGLFSQEFVANLQTAISKAVQPYSSSAAINNNNNHYSQRERTIYLPGDLLYRLQCCATTKKEKQSSDGYAQKIKRYASDVLAEIWKPTTITKDKSSNPVAEVTQEEEEEAGYLAVHVVCVPKSTVARPAAATTGNVWKSPKSRRRRRRPFQQQQGGDPKASLLERLHAQGIRFWSMNQCINSKITMDAGEMERNQLLLHTPEKNETLSCGLDCYVAVWRRPFTLMANYTKLRRDISQTPFFVVNNGKRQRLGASSVEEQILPAVEAHCGGLSRANEDPSAVGRTFAMSKFHASGREDMNVRMLLPLDTDDTNSQDKQVVGRPFCVQVSDALRMPTAVDLTNMVHQINHTSEEDDNCSLPLERCYGRNEMTSISPLRLVSGKTFSTLQADTESKVKLYGCLCWSENPLPAANNGKDLSALIGQYPLEIAQRTPLRVLHRRSNITRTRHVLTAQAFRVDDHHFRLHISTTAGTYVKEFVHGDLGRTIPSMASILGCKTDILELDCEGIKLSD